MSLRINQNVDALNSYRNLSVTQGQMSKSLEKLSSGFRINRAADDAAGLAISEGLRSQVGGLKVAVRNTQDGISVVQTAEGALTETHSILQRMRDLSVQGANTGGLDDNAKKNIQSEMDQLKSELTRITDTTKFSGQKLLDGEYNGKFQVGANGGESINVKIGQDMSAKGLGVDGVGVTDENVVTATATAGAKNVVAVEEDADATPPVVGVDGAAGTASKLELTSDLSTAGGLNGTVKLGSTELDLSTVTFEGADATARLAELNDALEAKFGEDKVTATITDGKLTLTGPAGPEDDAATLESDSDNAARQLSFTGASAADMAIDKIDKAIATVSTSRADLGALQNRFEHTINNLNVAVENLSASESRIRDTDMASEMMNFTRSQILSQAGTSVLAQANQAPQGVLSLLR